MKEEDIRKRSTLNRYLELVREDAARLIRDASGFHRTACPACGGNDLAPQFQKYGFHYEQCRACETLFVNPRPSYEDLMRIYVDSPSTRYWVTEFFLPMAETRREVIFKPRARFVAERFPEVRSGRTADIGAGFGLFLEELKTLWPESDVVAIEPSMDMAGICRSKGLTVIEESLEDVGNAEGFDLMTAFELFEHLHDPAPFVAKVHELLRPGGFFFLTTLNGLGFDIQVLWEGSKSIFPPNHLNFFNPGSMATFLEGRGFSVIEVATPGQLDWDIVEGLYRDEGVDPGRFFSTVSRHGTEDAKQGFQEWIRRNNFSSHMRIIARKV